jgi:thiol:disulfide interchange protein DsbC
MKKISLLLILLSTMIFVPQVFGFGGCETDCAKCHTLDAKDVQQIFEKMKAPEAKVLDIKMSPLKGLWEVAIEDKGTRGIMYVGFSKKYIMGGQIFEVDTATNKTQETIGEINQKIAKYLDVSKIPLDNALVMGDKNAQHKVVVFTDPDCPYCGKLHEELKKVISERKDIVFFLKLIALPMHPDAEWKSQSILCKKSLEMLEDNFAQKPVPKPDCETKDVSDNMALATELAITGTPTLIMPDGLVVAGVKDAKTIIDMVMNPQKKQK